MMKKKTTMDLIAESEKTTLYSISFEMDGTTEFEKFVAEFEMNALIIVIISVSLLLCRQSWTMAHWSVFSVPRVR